MNLVLQRYSAPEQSTYMDNNEQIVSVKALANSYYSDDIYRNRTKTFTYSNEHGETRLVSIMDFQ